MKDTSPSVLKWSTLGISPKQIWVMILRACGIIAHLLPIAGLHRVLYRHRISYLHLTSADSIEGVGGTRNRSWESAIGESFLSFFRSRVRSNHYATGAAPISTQFTDPSCGPIWSLTLSLALTNNIFFTMSQALEHFCSCFG